MHNFCAHTKETKEQIKAELGIKNIEELFSHIPSDARFELTLPDGISEMAAQKELKKLASKNNTQMASFLGGGIYNRFIPAAISQIAQRFEFITAYTPYQPEISQGTLQMIYEFQSMICSLTGMDVSNASVYDGATACAEAVLMATRIKKKNKILISEVINPEYKKVIETYCYGVDIQVDYLKEECLKTTTDISEDYACVLIQTPNYYGEIEDLQTLSEKTKKANALLVVCADILSLSIMKPPSEYGADIVVGDFQSLGLSMSYGGAHGGFMATTKKNMRQLPGRIVGMTLDANENRAFTLTLQTREQHIKRERATSNICTNQGLMALCATVYMTLMGNEGMKQATLLSAKNAKILANGISKIKGFEVLNKTFLNEFVIITPCKTEKIIKKAKEKNILAGIKLSDNKLLVCTTETNTQEEIDIYLEILGGINE